MVGWLASPPVDCYWTPLIKSRPPVFHNFHYSIIRLFLLVNTFRLFLVSGSAFYSSIVGYEEKKIQWRKTRFLIMWLSVPLGPNGRYSRIVFYACLTIVPAKNTIPLTKVTLHSKYVALHRENERLWDGPWRKKEQNCEVMMINDANNVKKAFLLEQ